MATLRSSSGFSFYYISCVYSATKSRTLNINHKPAIIQYTQMHMHKYFYVLHVTLKLTTELLHIYANRVMFVRYDSAVKRVSHSQCLRLSRFHKYNNKNYKKKNTVFCVTLERLDFREYGFHFVKCIQTLM